MIELFLAYQRLFDLILEGEYSSQFIIYSESDFVVNPKTKKSEDAMAAVMRVRRSCKRPREEWPLSNRVSRMGSLKLKYAGGDDAVSLQEPLPAIIMRSVTSKAWAVSRRCAWATVASES
jgi:hypothetical protein